MANPSCLNDVASGINKIALANGSCSQKDSLFELFMFEVTFNKCGSLGFRDLMGQQEQNVEMNLLGWSFKYLLNCEHM